MRRRAWLLGPCFAAAVLLVVPFAGKAPAQDDLVEGAKAIVSRDGTEIFRHWIHIAGFQPAAEVAEGLRDPHSKLIVVFGAPNPLRQAPLENQLRDFLNQGGALLLATDQPVQERTLGIAVTGDFVVVNGMQGYRGNAECPLVEPSLDPRSLLDAIRPGSIHSVFLPQPPHPIATNRPSTVRQINPDEPGNLTATNLAHYPNSARYESGRRFNRRADVFAVGGTFGEGRFLVLADQSVFINMMLDQERDDNGNNQFAQSCLNWLREGPLGHRTHCLFLEEGEAKNRFALPTPEVPLPPFNVLANILLQDGNEVIAEFEEQNWFNEQLVEQFGFYGVVRFILILMTIGLVAFGLFRLWNARTAPNPAALLRSQASASQPRGPAVRQRHAAQLTVGNLYEVARERVRRHFQHLGNPESASGNPPSVTIHSEVPEPRRLRKEILWLWKIGYGTIPQPVPRRDWVRFNVTLERTLWAADEGQWRFEPPADKT